MNDRLKGKTVNISIGRAFGIVLIFVFLLFGLTMKTYMDKSLGAAFAHAQKEDFNNRMNVYATLFEQFIRFNKLLLDDISSEPLFYQAVMQPEVQKANLADHMSRQRIIGNRVQMTLLDFEGAIIHASLKEPIFDYSNDLWVKDILDDKRREYFGVHTTSEKYFFTFATAIVFNSGTEGILLIEVPVDTLKTTFNWPDDIERENLLIYHQDKLISSLGPEMEQVQEATITMPDYGIKLVGHLDNSSLIATRDQIMKQVIILTSILAFGAILVFFFIAKRLFILPIERLRRMATKIAEGKLEWENQPSIDARSEAGRVSLTELSSLSNDIWFMAKIIVERERSLKDVNDSLEKRVHERTQDLKIACEAAENASKVKSEFLANMSHEIRTPMNGVLGTLNLLRRSKLDEKQGKYVSMAKGSAESLLVIINDILDFSKIEAGKLDIEALEFDFVEVLGEFTLSIAELAHKKNLELILDLKGLSYTHIKSDPTRIKQLLTNLVGNAIKFTHEGEIKISMSSQENGDQYLIQGAVKDTGVGIEEDKLEQLFSAFSQADASTTRQYGGTGLGLTITKQLCELMGGSISVSSEVGKGSEFKFSFIALLSEVEVHEEEFSMASLVCLVTDSNQTSAGVIRNMLRVWRAKVELANLVDELKSLNLSSLDYWFVSEDIYSSIFEEMASILNDMKLDRYPNIIVMKNSFGSEESLAGEHRDLPFESEIRYLSKPVVRSSLLDVLKSYEVRDDSEAEEVRASELKGKMNRSSEHNVRNIKPALKTEKTMKVLLVDDNDTNRVLVNIMLEDLGYESVMACDGLEALEIMQQHDPQIYFGLVLMDCQMPQMDGYEASRTIRRGEAGNDYKDIPIIALTANAMSGDREKCMDAKMDDYIPKPVEFKEFEEKVRKWLGQSEN